MGFLKTLNSDITALRALHANAVSVETSEGIKALSVKANEAGEEEVVYTAEESFPTGQTLTVRPSAEDETSIAGTFQLSRAGVVTYRAKGEDKLVKLSTPRNILAVHANTTTVVCLHPEGINAYALPADINNADDVKLLGAVVFNGLESVLQGSFLAASDAGESYFFTITKSRDGFACGIYSVTSSSFTLANTIVIPHPNKDTQVVNFTSDTVSGVVLATFDDSTVALLREGRVALQTKIAEGQKFDDIALLNGFKAIAGSTNADGKLTLSLLNFAGSGAKKLLTPVVLPFECDTTGIPTRSPVYVSTTIGGKTLFVTKGASVWEYNSAPMQTASGAAAAGLTSLASATNKPQQPKKKMANSLAAMMSGIAVKADEGKKTSSHAEETLKWLSSASNKNLTFVVRDEVIRGENSGSEKKHPVLSACNGKGSAARAVKYVEVAEGLAWSTILDAVQVIVKDTASISKAASGPSQKELTSNAAAIAQLAPQITALLRALAVKPAVSGAAASAASNSTINTNEVVAVFETLFVIILHALNNGDLEAATAAVQLADGLFVAHSTSLVEQCPFVVRRIVPLVQQVGRWSLTDSGLRLGQISAHCAPVVEHNKEAAVVPHAPARIVTTKPVHIQRETVDLSQLKMGKSARKQ